MRILVKLGGTLLDSAESRARLAREITDLAARVEIVVVHGGGKQMTRYLEEHGVASRFLNGLRVTTPEVLDAVLKIFAGTVNSNLVAALRAAGASPVGLTGIDAGLVDAEPLNAELGHVGRPIHSDPRLLNVLLQEHFMPVVACVAGDRQGSIYNVNGDQMAAACACSLGVDQLIFLTDVDGVRDGSGKVLESVSRAEAAELIRSGVASGGMQAKLEAALSALGPQVPQVVIAPGAYDRVLSNLTNGQKIGTNLR